MCAIFTSLNVFRLLKVFFIVYLVCVACCKYKLYRLFIYDSKHVLKHLRIECCKDSYNGVFWNNLYEWNISGACLSFGTIINYENEWDLETNILILHIIY